ncbi:unnamed protein product [Ceutorhynchus assimilis]|uniref:Uncharacterized protein n=1 Tax=Ceutorhynchus assimilis TaxID=467358 RepID=A0A9N9MR53_9CUCU|nr:unnamed protein product [Ceutorhynchus assimilis]
MHREVEYIVDIRPIEHSLSASSSNSMDELSAGTQIGQIWAGPSHWKLKPIRRTSLIYSGVDKNEEKLNEKKKPGRKRKRIDHLPIDFDRLKPPKDLTHVTNKPFKKRNLEVDEDKVTMPMEESSCENLRDNIEYLINIPTMKPITKTNKEIDNDNEVVYIIATIYDALSPRHPDYMPKF